MAPTLLRSEQERVLSAFPKAEATTLSKIALVTRIPAGKLATIADTLREAGFIEKSGKSTYGDLYRLTAEGLENWQRSTTARHASTPPLPFRSDRVRAVLSYLESQVPTRTRDLGFGLEIPLTSINALMQYLKRKKVVRTKTESRNAAHELTSEGRTMLAAMQCRARTQAGRNVEAVVLSVVLSRAAQ